MRRSSRDYDAKAVIYGLPGSHKIVANWLRKLASDIEKSPDKYAEIFTSRLMKPTE